MQGGTTFYFIDASPAEALETARKAARGQDVRIGGSPTVGTASVTLNSADLVVA